MSPTATMTKPEPDTATPAPAAVPDTLSIVSELTDLVGSRRAMTESKVQAVRDLLLAHRRASPHLGQ
jgi:hypothetical protein